MVRGPNVMNMNQSANAVITIDLAPTILNIAGLDPEHYGMDGLSLYPLFKNETQHTRD